MLNFNHPVSCRGSTSHYHSCRADRTGSGENSVWCPFTSDLKCESWTGKCIVSLDSFTADSPRAPLPGWPAVGLYQSSLRGGNKETLQSAAEWNRSRDLLMSTRWLGNDSTSKVDQILLTCPVSIWRLCMCVCLWVRVQAEQTQLPNPI